MKAQSSIEFLIIIGAVASFGLFAVGTFTNVFHTQSALLSNAISHSTGVELAAQNQSQGNNASVYLYLSVPSVSHLNGSNYADVIVVPPKGFTIEKVSMGSTGNVQISPASYGATEAPGASAFSFSFIPLAPGAVSINATVETSSGGTTEYKNVTADTYAESGQKPQYSNETQSGLSASISTQNESIRYLLGSQSGIDTVMETSHCSWTNFYGQQKPVNEQCGTPGWGYWISSSKCAWDATYCIMLNTTNAKVQPVTQAHSYLYNITLGIQGAGISLISSINDHSTTAALKDKLGIAQGNASILSAGGTGTQPYDYYALLNLSGKLTIVNVSYYSQYLQSLSSLESTLSFYNGTSPDQDTEGIINESIRSFDLASARLANAAPINLTGCSIESANGIELFLCTPFSQFYYQINATINPRLYNASQTISVQGSSINIR